jgi:hypothetical protein
MTGSSVEACIIKPLLSKEYPSLRAERSNPEAMRKVWIASLRSQ